MFFKISNLPFKTLNTYAVIFTSQRTDKVAAGYEKMAAAMEEAAKKQPGFLYMESVRGPAGFGITISSWQSLDAIKEWKQHTEHMRAQKAGKEKWYSDYKVDICKIQKEYPLEKE
jgi:heme-degrading monooxygenase HmoA